MHILDDDGNRRAYPRYSTRRHGHALQDGHEIPCHLLDISAKGARLRFDPIALSSFRGNKCTLQINGMGRFPAHVQWRDRLDMGLSFQISESMANALNTRLAAAAAISSGD